MAKKNDKQDYSYDDPAEEFEDFNDDYSDDVSDVMENIFNAHHAKIDFALRLTKLALDKIAKIDTEDKVFDVYKKALKVINETSSIEDTLKHFGMVSNASIIQND